MSDATHRRKRLVVKIGSATLTTSESSIDYGFLNDLADQVARVRAAGWDAVSYTHLDVYKRQTTCRPSA